MYCWYTAVCILVHGDLVFEASFLHTTVSYSLLEKVITKSSQHAYSVLLLRISKRKMSKLAIVQGEIFG